MSKEADTQAALNVYGPVPWKGAVAIEGTACTSLDLRAETGLQGAPDESCVLGPGHPFKTSVYGPQEGEYPTGEVRFMMPTRSGLQEVRLVGTLTGRPGIIEVTPAHLKASIEDPTGYLLQMQQWLGVVAA